MVNETDAMDFIGEMSQATGVGLAIGVNAYIENSDLFSSCVVLVDPSCLSGEDELRLSEYSERKGFRVVELWNDWGRFIKIMKLRNEFVSAFSP
jgi:hypothetical protein